MTCTVLSYSPSASLATSVVVPSLTPVVVVPSLSRKAKDYLEVEGIEYVSMELDERDDGNAIRATLGRKTTRTSVGSSSALDLE